MSVLILLLSLIVREEDCISTTMRIFSYVYLLAILVASANLEVDIYGGKLGYLWIDIPTLIVVARLFSNDSKLARSI
jgi:hypothetical protein